MIGVGGKEVVGPEERDCGFFCVLTVARTASRRAESLGYPCLRAQMCGHSSSRWMMLVEDDLIGDSRGTLRKHRENHEEEIDPDESLSNCEMGQGQSGRRVMVATDWDSRNGGHSVADDVHLDRDGDSCPCLDLTLDLCEGPCPGGHGLGRRSSGLSELDSYGSQP